MSHNQKGIRAMHLNDSVPEGTAHAIRTCFERHLARQLERGEVTVQLSAHCHSLRVLIGGVRPNESEASMILAAAKTFPEQIDSARPLYKGLAFDTNGDILELSVAQAATV